MKARAWIFRILAVLVLVALGACMMVIGRGHTVYFDNKTYESEDGSVSAKAAEIMTVRIAGKDDLELEKRDRKSVSLMGQHLQFTVTVQQKLSDDPVEYTYDMKVPYSLDGIVINLPALVSGLSEEIYLTEFHSVAITGAVEETEEPAATDEFGLGGDF